MVPPFPHATLRSAGRTPLDVTIDLVGVTCQRTAVWAVAIIDHVETEHLHPAHL